MRKYILEVTTFIAGGLGMIIELVAARILSPYLGSSNLIWTCIIGMMLAFMSLGYYLGGRISDKHPNKNVMSTFLLTAAIFTSIIPLMEIYVIEPLSLSHINSSLVAVICSSLTFGVPSLFLATVSPFAVKLKDKELNEVGKVSGKMSSFSTIGSIFGTFLAGFVLIPRLGVKNIILLIVIVLCLLSFILYENKNKLFVIKSIFVYISLIGIILIGKNFFFKLHPDIILDTDSEYSRIWVKDIHVNDKKFYAVQVDTGLESVATETKGLTSDYMKFYDLAEYYNKNAQNALMIGGAAYIYPTYYLQNFKDKTIDVVEIDEKMTEIAEKYFNLDTDNNRIKVYHQDGRVYLNKSEKKYDCILIDAFKGLNAPFQLTTYEALNNAKRILNDDGVVITNVVASISGDKSDFLKYEYSTYKKVFNNVKIFKAQDGFNDNELQNLILIGFKNDIVENTQFLEKYEKLLNKEIHDFKSDKQAVTDNLCPIGV
ncbi:MAG: fused MFS/spermidine synthase [Clostridia bacterium]|nr:fused MFS/spermidine synthase [Clostridia bacterium]